MNELWQLSDAMGVDDGHFFKQMEFFVGCRIYFWRFSSAESGQRFLRLLPDVASRLEPTTFLSVSVDDDVSTRSRSKTSNRNK